MLLTPCRSELRVLFPWFSDGSPNNKLIVLFINSLYSASWWFSGYIISSFVMEILSTHENTLSVVFHNLNPCYNAHVLLISCLLWSFQHAFTQGFLGFSLIDDGISHECIVLPSRMDKAHMFVSHFFVVSLFLFWVKIMIHLLGVMPIKRKNVVGWCSPSLCYHQVHIKKFSTILRSASR